MRVTLHVGLLACLALLTGTRASCAEPAGNNPLSLGGLPFFAADPSAVVSEDGRLFLFPKTDNLDWEKQFGWSCYSTHDLVNWKNHGVIFSNGNSRWGTQKAWASEITKRNGKYYLYFYFEQGQPHGGIGVAVANAPEGPFKEMLDRPLIRGHDPAVLADDDGRYWLYLQDSVYEIGDDMMSFKSGPTQLSLSHRPERIEATYVFKRNEIYYFTATSSWNNLIYYTADSPDGPFQYRGELMKSHGGKNHHCIVRFKDTWVMIFHERVRNDLNHQCRLRAELLRFNDDGSIQVVEPTAEGVSFRDDPASFDRQGAK